MTLAKSLRIIVFIVIALPAAMAAACYIAPLPTAASLTALQRAAAGMSYREIKLPSGAIVAYLDSDTSAPADKPVLLLLHGITSNKDIWLRLISHFDSYRVIAVDMPGHGDSREAEGFDYRVENLSKQVASLISTLSLPPAYLIGNSLGGLVAALYSIEHPDRVKSLVLMNSAGIDAPQRSVMMQRAMDDHSYNPLVVEKMDDIAPKLAAVLAHPPTLLAPIRQLMLAQELSRLEANKRLFSAVLADENNIDKLESLLPRLATPAMLLWGDSDQVFHYSSVAKAIDLAPALGAHIIEDCGHLPMLEAPTKTAAVLHRFFHTLGQVQTSAESSPEVMSAG